MLWYIRTRYLVFNAQGNWKSHQVKKLVPPVSVLWLLPVVVAYVFVHFSLVIGELLRLIGLKECGLVTQSLELGWPLSEFGTRVRAREDLFHISSPHKSGMPYCSVYREQYTLNIYLWIRLCITCRVVWRYVHSFSLTSDIAQVDYTKSAPQPYWRLRIVSIIWCYLFPVILKGVVVWVQIV